MLQRPWNSPALAAAVAGIPLSAPPREQAEESRAPRTLIGPHGLGVVPPRRRAGVGCGASLVEAETGLRGAPVFAAPGPSG
ncbi:MAG: hypothetical protein F4237_10990, partial [Gemmatimonadetes bacterium]|nr:hypothetical protein [Gemmatimonadota bacterium]